MLGWVNWMYSWVRDGFYRGETSHPIGKVRKNVREAAQSVTKEEEFVVLMSTGSYCPVHLEHIRMFEIVKQHYEKLGKTVVGGYMFPSHDDYVESKMKRKGSLHISGYHRWRMIEESVRDSSWIEADAFEVSQVYTTQQAQILLIFCLALQ